MWNRAYLLTLFTIISAEPTAPGIDRTVSDGVESMGFKIVYGDEDMTMVNEVVTDLEKEQMKKSRVNLNEALPPLPPQDVKCLMSVDRYCSKEMGLIKSVLIQALKDDCQSCTDKQKEQAGRVAASMMAHDSYAWKTFLSRSILQNRPPKKKRVTRDLRFKAIGKPEEVFRSKSRYLKDGFEVRVKRYDATLLP